MQGTVIDGSNNFFKVECDDGNTRTCSIKGKILKTDSDYYNPLAPGDNVELDPYNIEDNKGQILSVVPRKNEFVRWNVKKRLPQLLAANLDYLLIVTTVDQPSFRPRFIDRALAQAEYQKITPVIVCNKYDLIDQTEDTSVETQLQTWEQVGYKVMRVSAKTGEGMADLAALIENHLSALVGQSGVGKSSIINVLDNTCVLKTGSLSQKYGKGCHTTTKGTLIHLELTESLMGFKGAIADIIDTPGVRRFVLHDISDQNLHLYFKEFVPFIGKCGFGMSCSHLHEKNCAVIQAVEEGAISQIRYDSWKKIANEIKTGSWED